MKVKLHPSDLCGLSKVELVPRGILTKHVFTYQIYGQYHVGFTIPCLTEALYQRTDQDYDLTRVHTIEDIHTSTDHEIETFHIRHQMA